MKTPAQSLAPLVEIWDRSDLLERIIAEGQAGVPEPARAFALAGIAKRAPVTLVVLPRSRDAEAFAQESQAWLPEEEVALFPAWEVLPGESLSPTLETMGSRIALARALSQGKAPKVIVTSVRALLQKITDPPSEVIEVVAGTELELEGLSGALVDFGFERNYLVERPGEFSVRGGIVDIFPPGRDHPVRLDFIGDEVAEVRSFSVASQRSGEPEESLSIAPCRELRPTDRVRARALEAAEKFKDDPDVSGDLHRLSEGIMFPGVEAYLNLVAGPLKTLPDLLPGDASIVVADPKQCRDRAADFLAQAQEWGGAFSEGMFAEFEEAVAGAGRIEFWPYGRGGEGIDLDVTGWEQYLAKPEELAGKLNDLRGDGASVVVAAGSGAARAEEILSGAGLGLSMEAPAAGRAVNSTASVLSGFLLRIDKQPVLALVGERDMFGKRRAPQRKPVAEAPARASALLLELAAGDFVVHETYGVGLYHGMITRDVAGISRDYMLIEYHGGDRLYLPTEHFETITKYTGGEAPRLHRLGSAEWEKSKSRARRAVADIAGELTVLYSKRLHSPGFAFSPDTPWQAQLEEAFPFVETPDQQRAIEEVKVDMEKAVPMDRLVCGDVGFGKTEVAVRAAFKAVQDSKQVAVLVPTTILAQQHAQTFAERFSGFPVKVAQLSRFLSAAEQRGVLEGLSTGGVDVVIGTHRLLQRDIKFNDLGFLIVDEEQRFGVKHKEKIKQLRANVDVLTLTATPIPRTLEMGLTGIRDLSLMDTAPAERRPVLTYVGEADDRMITAAIRRELAREGQVFYVHNRVRSINAAARKIQSLVPGARVMVAHGQMDETELERVMLEVWDGKVDVLVCTTIIESGLDIQSMNTLIVERADRLGLSQLYQLRGRVGRARERAYAYFLYPHDAALSTEAHERLKTLSEFTELGSGFKIALRDLEIRGAGNMLGAEQSGHIAAVGFDLYIRMMSEAINELSGKAPEEQLEIRLDLPADAFVPATYIARESLRMEAYRQIEKVRVPEDAAVLREEFIDRYGPIPLPLEHLMQIAQLRSLLADHGIQEAAVRNGVMKLKPFPALAESQEIRLRARHPKATYKAGSDTLLLPVPAKDLPAWALETLQGILIG